MTLNEIKGNDRKSHRYENYLHFVSFHAEITL